MKKNLFHIKNYKIKEIIIINKKKKNNFYININLT